MIALKNSLKQLPYLKKILATSKSELLQNLYLSLDELNDIHIGSLGKTAKIDGSECIAEVGVIIERGEVDKVPSEAKKLFERFLGEI